MTTEDAAQAFRTAEVMTPSDRGEAFLGAIIKKKKSGARRAGQVQMARSVGECLTTDYPLFIEGGTGTGKALDVDTMIPTPNGFVRMGDLKAGDVVFDESGRCTRVLHAYDIRHGRPCYKVTLSDGSWIVADEEHLWEVVSRKARRRQTSESSPWEGAITLTTAELLADLQDARGNNNYFIPMASPLDTEAALPLPIPPYALGLWLAGTVGASDIAAFMEAPTTSAMPGFSITQGESRATAEPTPETSILLAGMGLLGSGKHVPSMYLFASKEDRRALLAGLLDSSGYVVGGNGDIKGGQVQFTDSREQLARNVMTLAVSLGFRATVKARNADKETTPWVVAFSPGEQVFHIDSKASRLATEGAPRHPALARSIISITPVETRPVRCITVDSANHVYLAGESLVPTHNSIGYLAGALAAHVENGRPVIIAPHTKALQDQLAGDLDLMISALAGDPLMCGKPLKYAVLKGRASYLCLAKVKVDEKEPDQGPDEERLVDVPAEKPSPRLPMEEPTSSLGKEVMALGKWADETTTGDRSDVPFPVSSKAWNQVSVTADECTAKSCPFQKDGSCFSERARIASRTAPVVVVNQAYLTTAMKMPNAPLLPENAMIVIDEAHEFPSVVAGAFGAKMTMDRLENGVKAAERSLSSVAEAKTATIARGAREWIGKLEKLIKPPKEADREILGKPDVHAALVELGRSFAEFVPLVRLLPASDDKQKGAAELLKRMLENIVSDLDTLAMGTTDCQVAWVESNIAKKAVMCSAQFDVSDTIFTRLIEPTRAVVFTSATLTIAGRFDHAVANFGADQGPWRGEIVQSPFNYAEQGLLYLPDDMPDPSANPVKQKLYREAVASEMVDLIEAAGGRGQMLCASHSSVKEIGDTMRRKLGKEYPLLAQGGDLPIKDLVRQFAEDPKTNLIGTRTLWTGVSVEGDTCAITGLEKIPFPYAKDPIISARSEKEDRLHGAWSGFRNVQLAEATLTMIQGAGREIRTVTDRGVVVSFDPRMNPNSKFFKQYGRSILNSLPNFRVTHNKEEVLEFLREINRTANDAQATVEIESDTDGDDEETE